MIKGSCMCGKIAYEVRGDISEITHCHCTTCRKAHASAFSSVAAVQKDDFIITAGEELIKCHESSPGKVRFFCSGCGSHIYARREGQSHYLLRLGTLDDDPEVRPARHIWLSLKAPWYDLKTDGDLPKYDAWPDDR